jgi:hypothetical protein
VPFLLCLPQPTSTAYNSVVKPHSLVAGEAKRKVNPVPGFKVAVLTCGYAVSMCYVIVTSFLGYATQGTDKSFIWCDKVIPVSAFIGLGQSVRETTR